MWDMWTRWDIGPTSALLAAVFFALVLGAVFGRAACLLPASLGVPIPVSVFSTRWLRRLAFLVFGPILAMLCVWKFGPTFAATTAIVYTLVLLTLGWIDAHTGLLPDLLSQPLLWLGLLVNLNGTFTPLSDAVLGAVAGYLTLWCVCQIFLLLTGRIGMGNGDFKLLAALGAWVGWMSLPWILLLSSSSALIIALVLRISGRMKANDPVHFGPYLAGAGILALLRLA